LNSEKYNSGDADDYESAVRDAISLGGDPDLMACIAGGVAQAYYKKVPATVVAAVRESLPNDLLAVVDRFNARYACGY
jgi:ADP-ribosylglycohydrolase